jgi:hypothetical protein
VLLRALQRCTSLPPTSNRTKNTKSAATTLNPGSSISSSSNDLISSNVRSKLYTFTLFIPRLTLTTILVIFISSYSVCSVNDALCAPYAIFSPPGPELSTHNPSRSNTTPTHTHTRPRAPDTHLPRIKTRSILPHHPPLARSVSRSIQEAHLSPG